MSLVKFRGQHFAFVFFFSFSNLYSLGKAFPRVIGSAAEAVNDWQAQESQENEALVPFPENPPGLVVIPASSLRQTAPSPSSIPTAVSEPARSAVLPSVLIPVVVPFGRVSVLQFLHLGGSVEGSSFVCFLQETVVDV